MYIISGSKATRVREEEPKEEVAGKRNIRERVKARNALPQNNRRGVSLPTVTRYHALIFREFSHPAYCAKRHTVAHPRRPGPLNYLRKSRHRILHRLSRSHAEGPLRFYTTIFRQARFCQLPMQPKMTALCTLLMFVVVIAISSLTTDAIPRTKRGLDLGLNRGFSGSQAAKHLMGLAAANYAGGPGRRRRSEQA
ncbi:Diuretic hormone class 2 [Trachymyrmex zeteki]|uniref:Diuretic hormone class 2 n=1 Tax=Mycetomoellerius zeteki TaxID=64791 RepID=A0A151WJK0_9HYME|nr:Diuretic hormone class 2 [Trachymyrmex zeteki]